MSPNNSNTQIWIHLIARFAVPLMVVFGVTVICVKDCADQTDPIDNSWKKVEHLCNLHVTDDRGNGFRIAYVTTKPVTRERLSEINSRQHIKDAMKNLQKDAPEYFGGSMLLTDIYDFAVFAKKYDADPALKIHCIFVMGGDKGKLYIGDNPKIPDSAEYIDWATEQGLLWINSEDVYFRYLPAKRIYRYWKCKYPHDESKTDEHFSHFSTSERI